MVAPVRLREDFDAATLRGLVKAYDDAVDTQKDHDGQHLLAVPVG